MNAFVMTGFGGVEMLAQKEMPTPQPGPGEVLVRVLAAGVNPVDWRIRKGTLKMFFPVKPPAVLGAEIAGEVAGLGAGATQFSVGDPVYAKMPGDVGGFAEYLVLKEEQVARRPSNLSAVEAAAVPVGATTALQSLRDRAGLKAGQRLLVNGASGGVGVFAVQWGRELGATVTAVCSEAGVDLVKRAGASEVIDYKKTDFATLGRTWDVIFDVSATRSFGQVSHCLEPRGVYVTTIGGLRDVVMPAFNWMRRKKGRNIIVKISQKDLDYTRTLVEAGRLTPVVERVFAWSDFVAAQTYMETGKPKGKIVVEVAR